MTRYFVTAVTMCPDCQGAGLIVAPIVRALRAGELTRLKLTKQDELDRWGYQFGYKRQSQWPTDEINCPRCNAKGFLPEARVDLAEALAELGFAPAVPVPVSDE